MCNGTCVDTAPETRIGARVDFFSQSRELLGNLIFLDPSSNGSRATHVRFTPAAGVVLDENVVVSVHASGDMTRNLDDCGLLHQFRLSRSTGQTPEFEMALAEPMFLSVGGDGIIGRRVSMAGSRPDLRADGIVGFNSALPPLANL